MTLSDLATLICAKIGQQEANDLAACKDWLKRRHELLWHEVLWKDSLVQFTQTLSPDDYAVTSTWLPTKGILLCHPIIERVLAARLDSRKLNVQRQEYYFRIDYDSFAKNGNPTEFVLLPPCVWEFEEAEDVVLARGDAGDSSITVVSDTLDSDQIGITRNQTLLAAATNDMATTERVDTLQKPTTTGAVSIGLFGPNLIDGTFDAIEFIVPFTLTIGETYEYTRGNELLIYANGVTKSADETFVATVASGYAFGGVDLSGQACTGILRTASQTMVTMAAADVNALRRQRIRLLEIPTEETTIRVLGKRTCPTFSGDNDEPAFPALTNCLIAFVHADMLQRSRRYGQAKEIQAEAVALLDQLKKIETVHQAHNVTIQPAQGYVSEYQFNSGAYSPLTF